MGNFLFENTSRNAIDQDPNRINSMDTAYINNIFVNNGFAPIESQAQMIKEKTKIAKAYEAPIMIKRSEIKLEKDGIEPSMYYISFKYTSMRPFDCNIYLNSTENFDSGAESYIPSGPLSNKTIHISNLPSGNDQAFLEKEAIFDMLYFQENKIFDKLYHDLVIECIITNKETSKVDCILSTYCKILKVNDCYKIKPDHQKLKVRKVWFDMHDVYGLEDNNNGNSDCEACYTNKKNTIFLPCMHSYSCNECSVFVRLRGNKCPLCREKITDTLLIEDSKPK